MIKKIISCKFILCWALLTALLKLRWKVAGYIHVHVQEAVVAEWLSSWLAEQEDRGSIPGLATWIFRDWLSPASKSRYGWKIAKSTLILKTTNQPPTYMYSEKRENLNGDLPRFALKDDKFPRERRIKRMSSIWDYFLFRIIIL